MNINIEKIPSYKVAYIRNIGPYGINNVQTMENLKSWAESKNLLDDESIILGIAYDNPKLTKPENCRYDTCLVVSDDFCIEDGYVNMEDILGGRCAVFKICHTSEAVKKAWSDIFTELSKHGYQLDETRPILERYNFKMVINHFCEICVPIK
jgi:DNA gyrase inhibitor GyrI